MPPKKGGAGAAKPAKGAKSDDSGDKGKLHSYPYFHDFSLIFFIFQEEKKRKGVHQ